LLVGVLVALVLVWQVGELPGPGTVNDLGASGPTALVTQELGHIALQESVKV